MRPLCCVSMLLLLLLLLFYSFGGQGVVVPPPIPNSPSLVDAPHFQPPGMQPTHAIMRSVRSPNEGVDSVDNLTKVLNDQPRSSIPVPLAQASRSLSSSDRAHLSHNISAVLENLLKNYNNQVRPGYHEGRTTIVKFSLLIRSMGPISEKDMKYSMECYLRQEWSDDRLRFNGELERLTLNIKMLEALWKPDTYFHNGLGSYVHMTTRPNKLIRINQNGDILYSMRLTIKAKCPMELRNFPLDKQSCPLVISSYSYEKARMEMERSGVSFRSTD